MTLATLDHQLVAGEAQKLVLNFNATIDTPRYAFVCLMKNEDVSVHLSDQRVTGVLAVCHSCHKSVAKSSTQAPPPGTGIDAFEFWTPMRRPMGKNLALRIDPPLDVFGGANLVNGIARPTDQPNAWVADFAHEQPTLRLVWDTQQTISRIELCFDTDFDHPMESVLMGHPERVMPFCVRELIVAQGARVAVAVGRHLAKGQNGSGTERVLFEVTQNHQSRQVLRLSRPVTTDCLEIRLVAPSVNVPAALFEVRCYACA